MSSRTFVYTFLALIAPVALPAQTQSAPSSFIFDAQNLSQHQQHLSSIYTCMGNYYQAVEEANLQQLDKVFYEDWFMRDDDTPNGLLNVEDKSRFIQRVKEHGPYQGYAEARIFAQTSVVNKLALIRIDKATSGNTTCFFLFQDHEGWRIMDKLWVTSQQAFTQNGYANLESLLPKYFRAVRDGDRHYLSQIMHTQWNLKQVNGEGIIHSINLGDFFEQLPKVGGYPQAPPLTSINLFQDKLAIIRLDWPAKQLTTFLNFAKIKGQWLLISERRSHHSKTP